MADLTVEEREIVATIRDWVDQEVGPVVRGLEHANEYPEKLIERMKQLGIYGLAVPEPYGEVHVSAPCYVRVTQELARGWTNLAGAMGGHTVVAKLLDAFGTQEQKERYLPKMATGEIRATMALTEARGGSDLQAMTTTARRDGDDLVIIGRPASPRSSSSMAPALPSPATCRSSGTRASNRVSSRSPATALRRRRSWAASRARIRADDEGAGDRPDSGRRASPRGCPGGVR